MSLLVSRAYLSLSAVFAAAGWCKCCGRERHNIAEFPHILLRVTLRALDHVIGRPTLLFLYRLISFFRQKQKQQDRQIYYIQYADIMDHIKLYFYLIFRFIWTPDRVCMYVV